MFLMDYNPHKEKLTYFCLYDSQPLSYPQEPAFSYLVQKNREIKTICDASQ